MSPIELIVRLSAAIFLCASLGVVSYWGAARLFGTASSLTRACATNVIGLGLASTAFHLLIPFHLFTLPAAVLGGLGLLAAVLYAPEQRRLVARAAATDRRAVRRVWRLLTQSRYALWVTVFALLCIPVVVRPWVTPPVAWDWAMYHGVKAALWVQNAGGPGLNLEHGPSSWELTRTTFAGGEALSAWAMLPTHNDYLVGASQIAQWLALGLALIFLARQIGVREPFATAAAGFVLAVAPIRLQVGSGYVEIPLALTIVLAVAFGLQAIRRGCPGSFLLSAASIGLGCAIKITALPVAAILVVFLTVLAVRRRAWRLILAGAAAFIVLASPWMVYNTLDTGAPLSPANVKVLGIELGKGSEAIDRMYEHPNLLADTPANEWRAFNTTFTSLSAHREGVGWPVLVPLLLLLVSLPILIRRSWQRGLLLALVAGASLAEAYSPAMWLWRLILEENFSRFLVQGVVLAVPISMAWCNRRSALARVYFAYLVLITSFVLLRYSLVGVARHEIDAMLDFLVGVVLVVLAVRAARRRIASPGWRAAAMLGAVVALLGYTHQERVANRNDAMTSSQYLHGVIRYWLDAARAVETPDKSNRIAVTHGVSNFLDTGLFYFLLGSQLQNELVYVPPSIDGSFFFNPKEEPDEMSLDAWLKRLRRERVDYVVSLDPATVELEWMDKHPETFRYVAGVRGFRGIYKLTDRDIKPREPEPQIESPYPWLQGPAPEEEPEQSARAGP